jgi:phosphopentomutase
MDMHVTKRVILIVLDSVGCGALPDAAAYGDVGANTLAHVAEALGGLKVPQLERCGLGRILPLAGVKPVERPLAAWGRMAEAGAGKDTIAGHWEMMGLAVDRPFALFPDGFPSDLLGEYRGKTGLKGFLGNRAASGTVIIQELGDEHVRTGWPIVYTSADSVFQIAAHEEVVPLPELYRICEVTRKICDERRIGRVIARPFVGRSGAFTRTTNRRDFPMVPPRDTALDLLRRVGWPVMGIGKIEDIFAGHGITRALHTTGNAQGMETLLAELEITKRGLIFINLVDFDMLYGHRNDPAGYGAALEAFDRGLETLQRRLGPGDRLVITADHGCDPTTPGSDHTREHVPLLVWGGGVVPHDLGTRTSFRDVAVSILEWLGVKHDFPGDSFW